MLSGRSQHMLSLNWNVNTLTGFGSLDNHEIDFTVDRQIKMENMIDSQIVSKVSQNVSHEKSVTPDYVQKYNNYYESLHKQAIDHKLVTIPEYERFQFSQS